MLQSHHGTIAYSTARWLRKGLATGSLTMLLMFALSLPSYAQTVNVTFRGTVDNTHQVLLGNANSVSSIIATDWDTSAAGWQTVETYSFTASVGDYIYVVAMDWAGAAMFIAEVTFSTSNSTTTVYTGVNHPITNWQVAQEYFGVYFDQPPDITTVNGWISGTGWIAPAVGAVGASGFGLGSARYVWYPPGGGGTWGFTGYSGRGTSLFRLQVVPEPASAWILGAGFFGLSALSRRRRA